MTGYPLRSAVFARADAALAEQTAGRNRDALLFPTDTGRALLATVFDSDFWLPAAIAAGWQIQSWTDSRSRWNEADRRWEVVTSERRQLVHTWHSLRHRFARYCIDHRKFTEGELMAAGGWENLATVQNRYYNAGKEHESTALAKF